METTTTIDLSQMSDKEALKVFLENAEIYTDTKGNTQKLKNFFNVIDFWGDQFKELAETVGRENMFIYSMNDSDQLLEGYHFVNIYCRFVTTQYFKLPEFGIDLRI